MISEYRLVWNPQYFKKDSRIFNEANITGMDFVVFMMQSANIMTLQLISWHLIILRDPIPQDEIFFKQTVDEEGKIIGAEWWSSDKPDRITINIVDIIHKN